MEGIIFFIFAVIAYSIIGSLLQSGAKAVGAGYKTITSGGSFSDNFSNKLQFKIEKLPKDSESSFEVFGVYSKGNPQIALSYPVTMIFKIIDKETNLPVLSTFDATTEKNSRVFEHEVDLGDMQDKYWPEWARVSAFIPETLIGPHKGTRNLELTCLIWYSHLKPMYEGGFLPKGLSTEGYIDIHKHEFTQELLNSGYMEVDNERLKIQIASIKLAVSIAMADGALDASEGNIIKNWVKKNIDTKKKLLANKSKDFNKVISINDLPISEIDKNISFENFKSSLIKYSVKSNYPDINK